MFRRVARHVLFFLYAEAFFLGRADFRTFDFEH